MVISKKARMENTMQIVFPDTGSKSYR